MQLGRQIGSKLDFIIKEPSATTLATCRCFDAEAEQLTVVREGRAASLVRSLKGRNFTSREAKPPRRFRDRVASPLMAKGGWIVLENPAQGLALTRA